MIPYDYRRAFIDDKEKHSVLPLFITIDSTPILRLTLLSEILKFANLKAMAEDDPSETVPSLLLISSLNKDFMMKAVYEEGGVGFDTTHSARPPTRAFVAETTLSWLVDLINKYKEGAWAKQISKERTLLIKFRNVNFRKVEKPENSLNKATKNFMLFIGQKIHLH